MTVAELLELLSTVPSTSEVILQLDVEANHFLPLRAVDLGAIPDGDAVVLSEHQTAYDAMKSDEEWSRLLAGPRVVVLAP